MGTTASNKPWEKKECSMKKNVVQLFFLFTKCRRIFTLPDESADPAGLDDEMVGSVFYDAFRGNRNFFVDPTVTDFYFTSFVREVLADRRWGDAELICCLALAEPILFDHPFGDFFSDNWYPIPHHVFTGSASHN